MVSESARPARARSAAEKHQRRDDILRAAERLWTTTPYADLSMNQVAREAQLAKGTLYLYFDTKEELFLALLGEHLTAWVDQITALLRERAPKTSSEVADVLLAASDEYSPLRRLLVLLGTVLERNVRPELNAEFQRELRARMETVVAYMPYRPQTTLRMLRHLYAVSIGWQQISEDVPTTAQDGGPAAVSQDDTFSVELNLAVRAIIDRLALEDARA